MEVKELLLKLEALEEENERLRKDCSILVQSNQEYRKENEQLRKKVKDWKFINDIQEKEIDALKEALKEKEYVEEENKQLRQTVHNLKQEPTNKDWDLLVEKCAELSQKNVELWEKIGELQKCKKDSPTKMENTMTKNKN